MTEEIPAAQTETSAESTKATAITEATARTDSFVDLTTAPSFQLLSLVMTAATVIISMQRIAKKVKYNHASVSVAAPGFSNGPCPMKKVDLTCCGVGFFSKDDVKTWQLCGKSFYLLFSGPG